MVRLRVLTLIFTGPDRPAVLVLEPIEEVFDGKSRIVPIWIGANEAMQLGIALEHAKLPRPMTHDLFIDAITNLDATIEQVIINKVDGQTFYARLFLRQEGRTIELDARPTDALSLAIREDAPFFIEEDVLDASSFPYLFHSEKEKEVELQEFHSFIDSLSPEDFNAL